MGAFDDEGVVTSTEWLNLWTAIVDDKGKDTLDVFVASFNEQARKELGEGFDVVQQALESAQEMECNLDSFLL